MILNRQPLDSSSNTQYFGGFRQSCINPPKTDQKLHLTANNVLLLSFSIQVSYYPFWYRHICSHTNVGCFWPLLTTLNEVVNNLKPTSCTLDIVPSHWVKYVFDTVGMRLLSIINSSLQFEYVPVDFKHAVVEPILKKQNLDSTVLSNYRPVSKLPFLFKFLEKVVILQLQTFLDKNGVSKVF